MAKATTTQAQGSTTTQGNAAQVPLHSNPGVAQVLRRAMAMHAAGGAQAQGTYTPNQWVQLLGGAYANTGSGLGKATARTLRGLVGRNAGTGVGRGNTYAPTTAAQLLALAGHGAQASANATPQAYTQANTGAAKVWQAAKASAAQRAQAKAAKATPAQG